jgi:hypothetical protein
MTLDESWFSLWTSRQIVSVQASQEPPESLRNMIGHRKMMVMIVWNPHGFHLIEALPKGHTFNAAYYVNIIPQPLLADRSSGPSASLVIHADNERLSAAWKTLNCYREKRLGIAPHPPYSPDLKASDFFLFGHVKHVVEGADFPSDEPVLSAIPSVLSRLTADSLRAVFTKWVERPN